MTLTFDLLTLVNGHTWRVTWSIPLPSLKILRLSVLELWVLASSEVSLPFTMRLQPLRMRRHIAWPMCRGQIVPTYLKSLTLICNFYGDTTKSGAFIHQTVSCPVLKTTWLSAHAQKHVSLARCRKYFRPTTIVLGDNDFPLTGSNFGNLTAFRAIFSHIFTAHAPKRLFVNFRLKFWHQHSIPWPRFP